MPVSPNQSVAPDADTDDAAGHSAGTLDPPTHPLGILRYVGPGLIVAGSIVGSGELIATTKAGAEAGFVLLWLIILGCVVKVFVQIEFGRYTLISGETTLKSLDKVPGPRIKGRGNWLIWYWVLMWFASISQLGGIVGGVGQALSISMPLTQQGRDYNLAADAKQLLAFDTYAIRNQAKGDAGRQGVAAPTAKEFATLQVRSQTLIENYKTKYGTDTDGKMSPPNDTVIWACVIAVGTSVLLYVGRYGMIQTLSTVLVGSFTLLTVVNLFLLQGEPGWRVDLSEFVDGLRCSLPAAVGDMQPIGTALAAFGIIGVGAAELVTYPYWCLEKGYGRFTGKNDGSPEWQARAAGWMRVMRVDAWGAMVIYTFATIAFYLLGAAVLNRAELNPEKSELVRTLSVMFVPVFSDWAAGIFLFGAFAVLYSTFFVANASHARVFSDAMRVVGVISDDETTRQRWIQRLNGFFPILCVVIFVCFQSPAKLVLFSGIMQGVMLPMLAAAALYFRYCRGVKALTPGKLWDLMLWLSAAAMLITGSWTIVDKLGLFS